MKDLFVDVRTRERPVVLYYFAKNGIVRWSVYGSFDYFELRKKKKLPEENWTLLTQTEENVFIDSGMACSDEYKLSVVLDGREVAYAVFPAIEEEATSSGFPLSSAGYRILDILPSVFNAHKNHVSKTKLNLLANTLGLGIDSTTKEIYRNMDAGSFAFFDPYGIDSYSFVSKTGDSVSVNGEEFFESRSVVPDSYSYEGRIFRFPFAETKAFSSWHISRTCAVRYQDFIDYLAFGYDWTKNEIKVLAYLTNEPVGRITLPGSENVSFAAMHIFEDTVYVLDKAGRSVLCFAKPDTGNGRAKFIGSAPLDYLHGSPLGILPIAGCLLVATTEGIDVYNAQYKRYFVSDGKTYATGHHDYIKIDGVSYRAAQTDNWTIIDEYMQTFSYTREGKRLARAVVEFSNNWLDSNGSRNSILMNLAACGINKSKVIELCDIDKRVDLTVEEKVHIVNKFDMPLSWGDGIFDKTPETMQMFYEPIKTRFDSFSAPLFGTPSFSGNVHGKRAAALSNGYLAEFDFYKEVSINGAGTFDAAPCYLAGYTSDKPVMFVGPSRACDFFSSASATELSIERKDADEIEVYYTSAGRHIREILTPLAGVVTTSQPIDYNCEVEVYAHIGNREIPLAFSNAKRLVVMQRSGDAICVKVLDGGSIKLYLGLDKDYTETNGGLPAGFEALVKVKPYEGYVAIEPSDSWSVTVDAEVYGGDDKFYMKRSQNDSVLMTVSVYKGDCELSENVIVSTSAASAAAMSGCVLPFQSNSQPSISTHTPAQLAAGITMNDTVASHTVVYVYDGTKYLKTNLKLTKSSSLYTCTVADSAKLYKPAEETVAINVRGQVYNKTIYVSVEPPADL